MISGKEKVAKILSRMNSHDSSTTLDIIASKDAHLAQELKDLMFVFEDVLYLETKDIELLHKKINSDDLLLSMKGMSEDVRDKLLSGVSQKKKSMLLEDLKMMGKVKLSDVEAARQRILDIIRKMIERGEISIDDEWIE